MRIKDGFMLRKLNNEHLAISTVDNNNFNGIIRLNPTSAFIWQMLEKDISKEQLIKSVASEFSVKPEEIQNDIESVLEVFKEKKILIGE